ncbi:hypothetical protein [Cohnella hashimotonis]|uniref:Uncharacterized protein n=1 Tax=Cohnella hashimotonis TaxID=2826895 RepID=A0ABT6TS56_9BACL|nr:hypothetical protein [Cohnella hashimotonis]MDI4649058.1 hypothetical protein [Cohnella hashimotonis]
MRALLVFALIAFLVHDWTAGHLRSAKWRTKAVYALLLLAGGYHFLISLGAISAPSYYDLFTGIYGGLAERIVAYLSPKGGV